MFNIIKHIVFKTICLIKVHELFRFLNRQKVVIILYHGVVEKKLNPFSWTQMPLQKFERQIEYISKKYNVLPLITLIEKLINNEELPNYSLAITFDDGLKNNYLTAFPVLKRFNLPATIFLTTCNIGSNGLLWFDRLYLAVKETKKTGVDLSEEGLGFFSILTPDKKNQTLSALLSYMKRLQKNEKDLLLNKVLNKLDVDSMEAQDSNPFKSLDWDDIVSMHQSNLISFGAHTETHNIMTRITREEVLQEIEISKKKIEEKLGNKCLLFAFPNGQKDDFNNEIKDAVKNRGFLCTFTTIGKFNEYGTDQYELGRFPIGSDVDEQYFKLLISGAIGFLSKIQSALGGLKSK
ncbi:MAG TPA: polysaccharide deacetylase family protein [Candidatus Brocadiia bacterium]|nr:polysaccharide deacetylase family protein [Candidatus Brocadiales bacterium]